jgi:endonuclease-3
MSPNHLNQIVKTLRKRYRDVKTPLTHRSPFQLLIATILSAQCTDRQVNRVTVALFQRYGTPAKLAAASLSTIEALIRSTGFYRNKARNIHRCAKEILQHHQGQVPATLQALTRLPGVGRKTANVVLTEAFGIPGVVVDTHVARLAQRLGLTCHTDPVKIESDLMALLPPADWHGFYLRLIFLGREICTARKPRCPDCPLLRWCPFPDKTSP